MKSKYSKFYINKMSELTKIKTILFRREKASWRNLFLLFRSGKKEIESTFLTLGYVEFSAGNRKNYWINYGNGWVNSVTGKRVANDRQKLFDALNIKQDFLELEIKD